MLCQSPDQVCVRVEGFDILAIFFIAPDTFEKNSENDCEKSKKLPKFKMI